MTGRRVLKADKPAPGSFADAHGGRHKGMGNPGEIAELPPTAKPDVIAKLQQVVNLLTDIQKLNNQLQGQYPAGSSSWHVCETMDDHIHEAFRHLGE